VIQQRRWSGSRALSLIAASKHMTTPTRSILHVDMDAFYASVEQRDNPDLRGKPVVVGGSTNRGVVAARDNPDLRGKPVVVGGSTNRGVVAAASYEARKFGIRSAMPMAEATRRCKHLVRVRPRMPHYKKASQQIFTIFRQFTPLVEGLSLDEAFLDVTASVRLFGSPEIIAANIKARIHEGTDLTASVGVAQNKLVAKIASDLDKPDGLTVVSPSHYVERLDPLPVRVIPGIGRETLKRLQLINVSTVRDLRQASDRGISSPYSAAIRRKLETGHPVLMIGRWSRIARKNPLAPRRLTIRTCPGRPT
jgi:DNA polymerase-4